MNQIQNHLKTKTPLRECAVLARKLLDNSTIEELSTLHGLLTGEINYSFKKIYVVCIWSDAKKSVEVTHTWEKSKKTIDNMGPGRHIISNSTYVAYKKGLWKGLVLDYTFFIPLSWPFSDLPTALGRYNVSCDNSNIDAVIAWRLQIGR